MEGEFSLGERLQDLRAKAGYSQEQLANLLGVSRQAISKWEGDQGKPELDNILKLAEIYRVSTDYVLRGAAVPTSVAEREGRPRLRELPLEFRVALSIIAVLAALALIFALFIVVLCIVNAIFF